MGMKLDRDVTVNGHHFAAGDDVDTTAFDTDKDGKPVKTDYADSIKSIVEASREQHNFETMHHGAVDEHGKRADNGEFAAEPADPNRDYEAGARKQEKETK